MQGGRIWSLIGLPCSSNSKESACNAGDLGSIPGLGRSSGEGNDNPLQYSCLENSMDRGTMSMGLQSIGSQRVGHDWATNPYTIRLLIQYDAAAAAKSLQSCPTLCDPRDGSPSVPVILQARTLEWVAISFSNAWKWKVKMKLLSRVQLLAIPWTAAYQAPLSMGFSRQDYWSGWPLPSPCWSLE